MPRGLPDLEVVERGDAAVDMQGAEFTRTEDIDDHGAASSRRVNPALLALAVCDVELARREGKVAGAVGGDHAIHDRVDLGPAAEIALMRDQLHVLLRHMFGKGERAGTDRIGSEFIAELFRRLFADDVAAVIIRHPAEKIRLGIFQDDANRQVVDLGDAFDHGEIGREGRALRVGCTRQRIDDVIGIQFTPAAVELDAFAQEEGPGLSIG